MMTVLALVLRLHIEPAVGLHAPECAVTRRGAEQTSHHWRVWLAQDRHTEIWAWPSKMLKFGH